jgi:uncharacterized protein (DUF1800 family)
MNRTPVASVPLLPGQAALTAYREEQARVAELPAAQRQQATQALNRSGRVLVDELARTQLRREANAPLDSDEGLVHFWFNHFNVYWAKDAVGAALPSYLEDAIRPNVHGPFRHLLLATTTHPAMLVYLDNRRNIATRRNENHARELLELHTLGVDGGYTQRDVQEVSRVLTGVGLRPLKPVRWSPALEPLVRADGEFLFDPRRHDQAPKVVLGHELHAQGFAEVEALLDLLARHPATARHVVRRLATYLLGDDPPASALRAAEQTFAATDGDLARVTRVLKDHRSDDKVLESFKDPHTWVLSALRLLAAGRSVDDARLPAAWLTTLGQPLFGRTTPDGYPLRGAEWISAGQLAQRIELARVMVRAQNQVFDRAMTPAELKESREVARLTQRLPPGSRTALEHARDPAEHVALLLASPEFMVRDAREERR